MKNWKDKKIKQVIASLNTGDRLIVPEFSRLGRSMLKIMKMLSILKDKEVNVYAVKGEWELNGSLQSKIMIMVFSIGSEIERDLITKRTKEALRARKNAGV
jgi:DNA invertase Pin-like site-specific DNA recombinase